MTRSRRARARRLAARAPTAQRETLERRWFRRLSDAPQLAPLLTGEALAREPLHRWMAYPQAFAPELVRLFLREAVSIPSLADPAHLTTSHVPAPHSPSSLDDANDAGFVLDPFAGAGTTVIECARRGVRAVGVEALASLAFLARCRGARACPRFPDIRGRRTWREIAERVETPIHRAALILAVARQHASDGRPLREPPDLRAALRAVLQEMRADLESPLPSEPDARQGDARSLAGVADGAVAGVLTSPPYLSRHDYLRVARPHEEVHAFWHGPAPPGARRQSQFAAHERAGARRIAESVPPAAEEAAQELESLGEPKLAGVTRSYFDDLRACLCELRRVLRPAAPCWLVVGGARLKGALVPSDLILAEQAESLGFTIEAARVARRLTASGRRLGGLDDVAPRETLLALAAPR